MSDKVLNFSAKKWLALVGSAVVMAAAIGLADHGVARTADARTQSECKSAPYTGGQPILLTAVDGSASTEAGSLRRQYAHALDAAAAAATKEGAYMIVTVFGASNGDIRTLCTASAKLAGAAPLFVTAQETALQRSLMTLAVQASRTNMGSAGSSIYGALLDSIQRVQSLRNNSSVPAQIVLITDGDEVSDGIHLRLQIASGIPARLVAARIIRKLPRPDAHGVAIEIEGVGHTGAGRPPSTQTVTRMQDAWRRICVSTHAGRCLITPDLLDNLS